MKLLELHLTTVLIDEVMRRTRRAKEGGLERRTEGCRKMLVHWDVG